MDAKDGAHWGARGALSDEELGEENHYPTLVCQGPRVVVCESHGLWGGRKPGPGLQLMAESQILSLGVTHGPKRSKYALSMASAPLIE